MIDKQLHARLSAAESDELVDLLAHPSLEEAQQLRAYLGPEVYQRMRSLALRTTTRLREVGSYSQGNVLFIPAMLHNELFLQDNGQHTPVWLSARAVAAGHLQYLRLDEAGSAGADPQKRIVVNGIMKRFCGELILTLAQYWRVRTFAYDWRKSLKLAATDLQAKIESFPPGEPVHIVAVGEGGIVARLYLALYPDWWKKRQGRLVTIGTPHQGAPIYLQALLGHLDIIALADVLDPSYKRDEFAALVRTFPSIYQLLPFADAGQAALLQASTYGNIASLSQQHLNSAQEVQALLRTAIDPLRMVALVGYGRPSCAQVTLPDFHYEDADGDGDVALCHAELHTATGEPVPTLYADVSDNPFTSAPAVLRALDDLLQLKELHGTAVEDVGQKHGLKARSNLDLSAKPPRASQQTDEAERARVLQFARRLRRSGSTPETHEEIEHERIVEASLTRSLLPGARRRKQSLEIPFDPPKIAIEAIYGDISKLDGVTVPTPADYPIDAIAVGHYLGGTAQGGLSALDKAISANSQDAHAGATPARSQSGWLLQTLLQRGTIGGELADLFFLPDPRPEGSAANRVITVVGMGVPGRLGSPELALLVRELCWTLGHIGKKHLVTIMVGVGQNNMAVADAVEAWVRGIKLAITGAEAGFQLQQITFVDHNPQRLAALDRRLQQLAEEHASRKRMFITHTPLDADERKLIQAEALVQAQATAARDLGNLFDIPEEQEESSQAEQIAPIRIAVESDGAIYRFAAVSQGATVADRPMELDAELIDEANNSLSSVTDLEEQKQQGEFLARFLLPEDFHAILSGGAPIVLTLDATSARIHWEMLCLSEQQLLRQASASPPAQAGKNPSNPEEADHFLGTAFGLTRQLRTAFARPAEPLPQHKRLLRVLVVADPAADARLPAAEEEGNAVADLLELYNQLTRSDNRIEVVRLIGPAEATRVAVLQHLITRSYDVLHFAGHCIYDTEHPRTSGWIFGDNERLTAAEIRRVDRVPSLVVSNACESGVTPVRAGERSAELAPTFAETFFARGVSNFICTAWPVGDREARDFALTLYANLLGLHLDPQRPEHASLTDSRYYGADRAPAPFHAAMREARRIIAGAPYDRQSWGAYQHYGNPYARLFAT
jgi:pimeloyl-ACP methyl ester carboxylesterase